MYYNLRSKQKAVAAGTALAAVLLAWIPAAHAAAPNPAKCKAKIAKASSAWEQAKLKALAKCEAAKRKGKKPASQDCLAEAKAAAAITTAQGKLTDAISGACTGLTLTQLGWDGSGTGGNPVLAKACTSGDLTGSRCERESECPGICVGGEKDTQSCSFPGSCANKVCQHAKCSGGSENGNDCSSAALKATCVSGGGTCPFLETCSVSGGNIGECTGGTNDGTLCRANSDCTGGGHCQDQCNTGNLLDCVGGYCEGGLCLNNTDCGRCTGGSLPNNGCAVDSDCGKLCNAGTNSGGSCKVDGDCPSGGAGSCATVTGACSTGTCSGGFCSAGNGAHGRPSSGFCLAVDRCPDFENNKLTFVKTCDGGANNGKACTSDTGCGGMVCDNNRNTHCTDNTPCGTGNCVSSCNQGCSFALSTPADVTNCVECLGEASVDQLNNLFYGKLQPTGRSCKDGPNQGLPCQKLTADADCAGHKCIMAFDEKAVDKCKNATAAKAVKFFAAKRKALEKCEEAVLKSDIPGPCSTDVDTQTKIATAAGKLQEGIAKACGGDDDAFGGGDDIVPSSIVALFNCNNLPNFPAAPGTSCAGITGRGPITTLQDLANCIQCVTEFKVDCLDSIALPANGGALAGCNPRCGNGKLDGHCSTTTTTMCSSSLDCPAGQTCVPTETCDDSNPATGDSCPGNCNIALCSLTATPKVAKIALTGPAGVNLGGVAIGLHYSDGVIGIAGSGGVQSVQDAVNALGANFTANDLDYAIRVAVTAPDAFTPLDQTDVLEVTFHTCSGGPVPTTSDFRCVVESAADLNGVPVAGVTCAVTLM